MTNRIYYIAISILLAILLSSCRGKPFTEAPVHIQGNMDWQPKFEAQEANAFFPDNKAMREPVEGTVARGNLDIDRVYHEGVMSNGSYAKKIPLKMSRDLIVRGKERYEIFCTPCHGGLGDGKGIIIQYGYVPPPSFHEQRIKDAEDGYLYNVIYNGVRSMPSYRHQIPVEDRWAIVAYIRALQKSQDATEDDLKKLGISLDVASSK